VDNNIWLSSVNVDDSTDGWVMGAWTWDGTTFKLYHNGENIENTTDVGEIPDFTGNSIYDITIGDRADTTDYYIDEFKIFTRPLSSNEIKTLYDRESKYLLTNKSVPITYTIINTSVGGVAVTEINYTSLLVEDYNVTMSYEINDNGSIYNCGTDNPCSITDSGNVDNISIYFEFSGNGSDTSQISDILLTTGGEIININYIELLFSNLTSPLIYKVLFDEDEHFFSYINWTDDNSTAINDTQGSCNITLPNGIVEEEAPEEDFTLCNDDCDQTNPATFLINHDDTNSTSEVVIDWIEIEGLCHTNQITEDLLVNFSCSAGYEDYTIPQGTFPICSAGTADIRLNSSVCIDEQNMTIELENNAQNNIKGHTIHEVAVEREFVAHIVELIFNSTLELWQTEHYHEYHEHEIQTIIGNCNGANYTNSTTKDLTILNAPPVIYIEAVNNTETYTNLYEGIQLWNVSGNWTWYVAVVDDDLVYFNVSWYDNASTLLKNYTNITNVTELMTDSTIFNNQNNPYKIEVVAIDSYNETTTTNLNFSVDNIPEFVITIHYPADGGLYAETSITANFSATNNVTQYNITLDGTNYADVTSPKQININNTGIYELIVYGYDIYNQTANATATFSFVYESTELQEEIDMLGLFWGLGILVLVSLILTIFFYVEKSALRYMFMLLTFFLLTIVSFVAYIYTTTITNMPLSGLFYAIYWSFLMITILILLLTLWDLVKKAINYFQQRKDKDFNDNF